MGLASDSNGELFILAGEGTYSGQRNVYKVPLPTYDAPLPQSKALFINVYDGDILIGSDDASHPNPLEGEMILCSPIGSPLFPCSMQLQGKIVGWKVMMTCNGGMGCEDVTFQSLNLNCDTSVDGKDSPTFEISSGARFVVLDSSVSGCSSKVTGGLVRAFDAASLFFERSTVSGSSSLKDGGAVALYGSSLHIINSVFEHCKSGASGGSIWSRSFNSLPRLPIYSSISIVGSSFNNNAALLDGGATYFSEGTLTLESSSFESNSASGTAGGGAICVSNVKAQIVFDVEQVPGESVENNTAKAGGGGVLLWLGNSPLVDVVCAPGFQGAWSSCLPCAKGTFKQSSGTELCVDCRAGTYGAETGATTCTQCGVGKFLAVTGAQSLEACEACLQDMTSPSGSGTLNMCVPTRGFDLARGVVAAERGLANHSVACPAGAYKSSSGTETCAVCNQGTYSSYPGSTFCMPCPVYTSEYDLTHTIYHAQYTYVCMLYKMYQCMYECM